VGPSSRQCRPGRKDASWKHGKYSVRAATDADDSGIREVRRRTWHDAYDEIWGPETIEAFFGGRVEMRTEREVSWRNQHVHLVAETKGQIVAVAASGVHRDGEGELRIFYVLPEHQGEGLGRRLWDETLWALRECGCDAMCLWALERNLGARRFYERRGCAAFARRTLWVGDRSQPEVGYRLDLPAQSVPEGERSA